MTCSVQLRGTPLGVCWHVHVCVFERELDSYCFWQVRAQTPDGWAAFLSDQHSVSLFPCLCFVNGQTVEIEITLKMTEYSSLEF